MYYGIHAEHLTVWIASIDVASNVRAGVLCRRHADAMVVPLGWMLDDQREPVPQLFKAPPAAPQPAERHRRQRPQRLAPQGEQLSLPDTLAGPLAEAPDQSSDAPLDEAVPSTPHSDVEETIVQPWAPVFDESDDLDGLLGASGPLLSRAFRGTHRTEQDH